MSNFAKKELKINSKIGHGTYSKTYSVSIPNNDNVVMKRNFSERQIDWCFNIKELDILARLKNYPFIISIEAVSFDSPFKPEHPLTPREKSETKDDSLYFFMERMLINGRSFFSETDKNFDYFVHITVLSCHLLLAVEYIHSQKIIHSDIKPDNILIGEDKNVEEDFCGTFLKLADFGMSQNYCKNDEPIYGIVTSWYRAPEITMGIKYSYPSDMWSVGCVLYEMLSYCALFHTNDHSDQNIYNVILDRLYYTVDSDELDCMWKQSKSQRYIKRHNKNTDRIPLKDRTRINKQEISWFDSVFDGGKPASDNFFELMESLLVFNPDKRKTATEALNMPFFDGMRDYIQNIRDKWKPIFTWDSIHIKIYPYREREWISMIVANVCNKYSDFSEDEKRNNWFSYRIIFQAISLFDRYIVWCNINKKRTGKSSDHVGMFETSRDIGIKFRVILYVSYKYFLNINSVCYSWEHFVEPDFYSEKINLVGKKFEELLIKDVLNFEIYKPTVYEYMSEKFGEDFDVMYVLEKYLKIESYDGNLPTLCEMLIRN